MLRCPKCHRFGVEHDLMFGYLRCLWRDCSYRPDSLEEIKKEKKEGKEMKKLIVLGILIPLLFMITGCASIVSGRYQPVKVSSVPDEAKVRTDTGHSGVTPCTLNLERSQRHIITIMKEGYKRHQTTTKKTMNLWVFGNIIWGLFGGLIGAAVDTSTGAACNIEPCDISVILERE